MAAFSAGIILYKREAGAVLVLLTLAGGPYWRNRDFGAWMIPKGGVEEGEDAAAAAVREFEEELGTRAPGGLIPLCRIRQAGGKWVEAFAVEGDLDAAHIVSNSFEMEWPPRSGKLESFPEIARAEWMPLSLARQKILASQLPILDHLEELLGSESE